jgi:rubrerythrin
MKTRIAMFALLLGAAFFTLGRITAGEQPKPHPQTTENLYTAMHGEAFAYARYLLFAEQARKNGNTELADLFERTAAMERLEHLREQAGLAGVVKSDVENLKTAIQGESQEAQEIYPRFALQALAAGDETAAALFAEISHDEAKHRAAFRAALSNMEAKQGSMPGH